MISDRIVEWKDIPWRKLEKYVFKLQNRIFKASQEGDVHKVRKLQKTLMKSRSARSMAVRQVTQDNQGKNTGGIDKIKSLTQRERLKLVDRLKLPAEVKPTRRVWIPKPGTEEKRPLGIPTMDDRALQALTKKAIEPEWEAKFEPNSYGFRPGRSAHDAVAAIYNCIQVGGKYVLDADIAKCFDRIDHDALLSKLNTYPTMRRQIKRWLKAGVMEGKTLFPTEEGTPQGGVISPLLANVALHGLEMHINKAFPRIRDWRKKKGEYIPSKQLEAKVIRYADDFVVIHDKLEVILKAKEMIGEWLAPMGLELKSSKTHVTHTLQEYEGRHGFNFLGFTIKQTPVGKNRSGMNASTREKMGFKRIITPSREGIRRHYRKMTETIDRFKALDQVRLIEALNPQIRGWTNYYSKVVSAETFRQLDHQLFWKLWAWAGRRHKNKSRVWRKNRYWKVIGNRKWEFSVKRETRNLTLYKHSDTPITRHCKVQDTRSPFDGDWIYWGIRMGQHPEANARVARLLKIQKGKCNGCKLYFKFGDTLEVDHKQALALGGKEKMGNLQVLHKHCHISKTTKDQELIRKAKLDKQSAS